MPTARRRLSQTEETYRKLKRRILDNALPPGSQWLETELAGKLGRRLAVLFQRYARISRVRQGIGRSAERCEHGSGHERRQKTPDRNFHAIHGTHGTPRRNGELPAATGKKSISLGPEEAKRRGQFGQGSGGDAMAATRN